MAIYVIKETYWMLPDDDFILMAELDDTGLEVSEEEIEYDVCVRKKDWILDNNNNVLLSKEDNEGLYINEAEMLDYVPYKPTLLLDSNNNAILQNEDTVIVFNFIK